MDRNTRIQKFGREIIEDEEKTWKARGYIVNDKTGLLEKFATKTGIEERLEYLRGEINAERISYAEIAELQSLKEYIDPSDTQLLEWAGVDEA